MQRPIVTLTTDFGQTDHYVGTMKGVILGRCPDAQLVDISHEVARFSVHAGAYTIGQAAAYFPSGTVHLVVIDPGVGTERKPLLVEAIGQYFIAPDNGVLSFILARDPNATAREILNRDLWLPSPSATFHGRDVFAPAAGALAARTAGPQGVGPLIEQPVLLPQLEPRQIEPGLWEGTVLSVDYFGNVITNFKATGLQDASKFTIFAGSGQVSTFGLTFGNAPRDLCFAYLGSSGFMELGMNQGNAADWLKIGPGDSVHLKIH